MSISGIATFFFWGMVKCKKLKPRSVHGVEKKKQLYFFSSLLLEELGFIRSSIDRLLGF